MAKIHSTTVTATSASLGSEVTLVDIQKTEDIDLSFNVYRRQESIHYRSQDKQSAHVAFVASEQPISTVNVHIADSSSAIVANRLVVLDEPRTATSIASISVPTDKFVVTDVFSAVENTPTSTPLFYKHIISTINLPRDDEETLDLDPVGYFALLSAELLDTNFNPVNTDAIKIDWEKGIIYNNFTSSFDLDTGNVVAYYVRYSSRDIAAGLTQVYTELLNNEAIFQEATFEDLDGNMQIINDGRKVYLVEDNENTLTIVLPIVGNYSFQLLEDARIKILPPPQQDIQEPWYIRVSNGKFFTVFNNITYKYSVAEFTDQAWDPGIPLKRASFEDSDFVSAGLLKLNRSNINVDPEASGYLDVLVYNDDGDSIAAFTTNSGKSGLVSENAELYQTWTTLSRIGIRSIDAKTGLVDLDGFKLRSDDRIVTSYTYNEDAYELIDVDFNPLRSPSIRDKFAAIFIEPVESDQAQSRSVFYTLVDSSGKVVESNLPNFNNTDQKIRTSDDIWREAYYNTIDSGVQGGVLASGAILFIPTYTVVGSGLFLPLGEVSVGADTSPDSSTVLDVRIRGGGVKEGEIGNARFLQPESKWYWDTGFWDGTPYPGTATYLVEIPVEILEVAGGVLQTDQARDIVERHTAGGIYPIAKAYGIEPLVSGVLAGDGSIRIAWRSYSE